jgi:lipoate-protein ligase A
MHFLDLTLPDLADNLALDEALLLEAEAGRGGEVLRFWEWPTPAVVLGMGGVIADDVDADACEDDAVPLGRRSSGGGTVLLGRGCLLFSLILDTEADPRLADITRSYAVILGRVCETIRDVLPGADREGISDLAADGCKFSGNAQQRKRRFILHHGTLLYDLDLRLIPRYLREPPRRPEYRGGRRHAEFVCNLPADDDRLRRLFRDAWAAHDRLPEWPRAQTAALVEEKYATTEWVWRR